MPPPCPICPSLGLGNPAPACSFPLAAPFWVRVGVRVLPDSSPARVAGCAFTYGAYAMPDAWVNSAFHHCFVPVAALNSFVCTTLSCYSRYGPSGTWAPRLGGLPGLLALQPPSLEGPAVGRPPPPFPSSPASHVHCPGPIWGQRRGPGAFAPVPPASRIVSGWLGSARGCLLIMELGHSDTWVLLASLSGAPHPFPSSASCPVATCPDSPSLPVSI